VIRTELECNFSLYDALLKENNLQTVDAIQSFSRANEVCCFLRGYQSATVVFEKEIRRDVTENTATSCSQCVTSLTFASEFQ